MSPAPPPLPGFFRAACAWSLEPCSPDAEALSLWGQRPRSDPRARESRRSAEPLAGGVLRRPGEEAGVWAPA